MADDIPSPEAHAQGWRLITDDARPERRWIETRNIQPSLLLVLDSEQDWWAVASACQHCGADLAANLRTATPIHGLDELRCAQCATAHGPKVSDCTCVALMVVDQEIYAVL